MEYMTMAQAVGEKPVGSPVFMAGIDFDPADPDEVEIVAYASAQHRADEVAALRCKVETLQREAEELRELVARMRGCDEED